MERITKRGAAVLLTLLICAAAADGFQRGRQKELTPAEKEAPARRQGQGQSRDPGPEAQFTPRERLMLIPGIARPIAFVRVLRQLDLTPEQQEKMIVLGRRTGNQIPVLTRLRRAQNDALDEAIYSSNFDLKVVEQRAADLAATQAELTKLQARVMAEIRQILTSEQAIKFRELLIQERDRLANPPPSDQARP